jgi:hypothetical protein
MRRQDLQRNMYELRDAAMAQRVLLAVAGAACVAIVWWLLFGGGLHPAAGWLGRAWKPRDATRRAFLAAVPSIYYIRIPFPEFVFLTRGELERGLHDRAMASLHLSFAGNLRW